MSIEDRLRQMLVDNGLWPEEAAAVIGLVRRDERYLELSTVLSDSVEGYPWEFMAVAWLIARTTAADYLAACKPRHLARSTLDDSLHL